MKNLPASPPTGRIIVLDTAALIAGSDSLYALGGLVDASTGHTLASPSSDERVTFCTIPDVINEVRDKRARARLALLDRAIVVRPPSSDALASVINFAKATGDFSVLSMTDLKVMALCWMLEFERNGGKYLKPPPERVSVSEIRCGKLIPFDEVERLENAQETMKRQSIEEDDWTMVKGKTTEPNSTDSKNSDDIVTPPAVPEAASQTERKRRRRRRRKKQAPIVEGTIVESSIGENSPNQEDEVGGVIVGLHEMNVGEDSGSIPSEDEDGEEDDGVGWINTENLAEHLAREGGEEEQTEQDFDRIGCVTTDFAMQNTMLQMGLKLLSVDGRRTIRKIKHFALRCHTCGCVTTEHERKFCYRCGNATMHRVAFKVNKKGVARSYLNPKKRPVLRGTKYPIPMPRGGRHNRDLILCEDQIDPVKQKRLEKQRERLNVDVLDPSNFYNAGARFDPNNRPLVVGYGRRNPNEVRRTSGRNR